MTQWKSQEGRSHVKTAGAESDCLAWSNRAARLDAALYIALLTRMRMNYIEGCVAQSLKMQKSSTPAQNQAQIQNRILILEPTASDWRKLLGNVNSLLVKRCIANHDFLNHISLMLGLLTECEKQAAAEKSR